MNVVALRLNPGEDLKQSLVRYCCDRKIEAAYILCCVGSLRRAVLRVSNHPDGTVLERTLEILSLSGTLSRHGAH